MASGASWCATYVLNVLGPVLVLATIQVASAIITEATLSFLGGCAANLALAGHLDPHRQRPPVLRRVVITIFPGLMIVIACPSICWVIITRRAQPRLR